MVDVICDHCKAVMKKRGVLFMSNSKFEVYRCSCGNERKICLGLGSP
jgi:membrane-bound acyltransferase YfiQ involved in biofilm formation